MVALHQAVERAYRRRGTSLLRCPDESQPATTVQQDCADILALMQEDEVDLAIWCRADPFAIRP